MKNNYFAAAKKAAKATMTPNLTRIARANTALVGMHSGLRGYCSDLRGNCSGLRGDCSGLRGNCSGLQGDLDTCGLTEDDRANGVDITKLVRP